MNKHDDLIEEVEAQTQWQPIETFNDDDTGGHIRGLYVRHTPSGKMFWEQFLGYVDEDTGQFVTLDGDYIGWDTEAYTHYMPLPPAPEDK